MTESLGGNAKEQLKSYIERVERLEEEKQTYSDDIRDVYAEAKRAGFNVKAMRAIIRRRKDQEAAAELDAVVESYAFALQMDLPLGGAAKGQGAVVQ